MSLGKRCGAEFFGTFWLVFGGCGSAVLAAAFPQLGIGFAGVALAFGLTLLTMAYAIGHISGCHINPAVSVGLWAGGRFPVSELVPYIVAQVLGGAAASTVLYFIASGKPGFELGRIRVQRICRAFAGWILAWGMSAGGDCSHVLLSVCDSRRHPRSRAGGFRRNSDRPEPYPLSPDRDPCGQPLREPGTQHRAGSIRAWLGAPAALALLGCSDHGCCYRRASFFIAFQRRIES